MMAARKLALMLPLVLSCALFLSACDDDKGPAAPESSLTEPGGEVFDPSGPATTTPVPGPVAFDQVLEVTTEDGCTLPGGPYARFVRRIVAPQPGTHPLTSDAGFEPCNDAPEDAQNHFTWSSDGGAFAWTASVPVGAVILQSGSASRVYVYGQRSWGDEGLYGPTDAATGAPLPVDAVVLCHDYALEVRAEVEGRLVRRIDWSMQGELAGGSWDLFPGDRATSQVDLQLAASAPVNEPATAVGEVAITNNTPLPARLASVTNFFSGGYLIPIDFPVSLPVDLEPGHSLVGTYWQPFPNQQTRTNTVTANAIGDVRGGSARSTLEFGERVTEGASVVVSSSDGRSFGPFTESSALVIDRVFEALSSDPPQQEIVWTLTLDGAQGDYSPSVLLRRHDPVLELSAEAMFARRWSWFLDHGLVAEDFGVRSSTLESVRAWVRAWTDGGIDSDFGVRGGFELTNLHPSRVLELESLEMDAGTKLVPLVDDAFAIAAGAQRAENFDVSLAGGDVSEAILVARYKTHDFTPGGGSTPRGSAEIQAVAPLDFAVPTSEIDASAWVGDTIAGELGQAHASAGPVVIEYLISLESAAPCGSSVVEGIARLRTIDSVTDLSMAYAISVEITCEETTGCTRGRGYWRNHPDHPAWSAAGSGGNTPLFGSGASWRDVLVQPGKGDPYFQLAAAWVTARLNELAGADASSVSETLAEAADLLATHAPGGVAKHASAHWRALAERLQDFNEGRLGPGSCDD